MQNKISIQAKLGNVQYRTALSNGKHTLLADEPESEGGLATGPTPDELLAMALAACTSITLRMYSQRKNWDLGEIAVAVDMQRQEDGSAVFERKITFEKKPDAATCERLMIVADKCPVHKTLSHVNTIISSLQTAL